MPWNTTSKIEQRRQLVSALLHGKTPCGVLCQERGISPKTAYKWLRRFEENGRAGLSDQSRAARRLFNRPAAIWLKRVWRWRQRHPSWGAPKLHWSLKRRFGSKGLPSESAISRWLKKWGLTRRRRRRSHKGPMIKRPVLTEAREPNEVWTADFKGAFRTGDGTRLEPLTVRDLASRYALAVDLMTRPKVEECQWAFARIFTQYGLPTVIRVDNGSPFGSTGALGLTRLSAWWVKLGIRVEFTAPGHPEQNGAHEQFHRVYKDETLSPPARSLRQQRKRSELWRRQYNRERPHESLQMRVPAQVYRKSRRKMAGTLKPWRYAEGWPSRLVRSKGMVSFQGQGRFVGQAFEGDRIGLKAAGGGVWEVYFGPLRVGELWDWETSGIRALWHQRRRRR
jgi:transposase InsO family protein